ncbi:hypothetical protein [Candidatus Reidiella endopervernicosa]|uniref:Nuclear transport factor 2 family protein n=1 Tax=Candidatus Reidiella endopervernicosa TaxID=2738883 RepID=A0A6N0HU16_9GAMM|nr:hypothetical protein [Candidatus Reidiella endopervernicosa]QKQ25810.1 hypothetical protein HUE57_05595 [Candidatus Reidiella endopervernicosa]
MEVIEVFKGFAADFELCVADDNWSRLAKWLAEDAIYLNVGGPDPRFEGRDAIINYLREDVMNLDRRFDSRTLEALTKPRVDGSNLNRRWRVTYTLSNALIWWSRVRRGI